MINAKEEFIGTVRSTKIIAAEINVGLGDIFLKKGYTEKDYNEFLNKLDVEYDDGFGFPELHGTIYCENGIWFERGEYDGSEWWDCHCCPDIPDYLGGDE